MECYVPLMVGLSWLENPDEYRRWRAVKLAAWDNGAAPIVVEIADPACLSDQERGEIAAQCQSRNMVIYDTNAPLDGPGLLAMAAQVGLQNVEHPLLTEGIGVTELAVADDASPGRAPYIPYTDKPLSWHTDGYNNPTGAWVRSMVLHCVRPAASGGALSVLDPDLAYIRLRDENPDWITALSHPEALTIPANELAGDGVRDAISGPVFAEIESRLVMRYTHRQRHAVWRDDMVTKAAQEFLRAYLDGGDDMIATHRLTAGQGIICNNVLHRRNGFEDALEADRRRLVYRARFRDRVSESGLSSPP